MEYITKDFVQKFIKQRNQNTNKNHYGRVLTICGCVGYTGAAYFCSQAAVKAGSGVVTSAVPKNIYPIIASKLNEPVVIPIDCDNDGKFCEKSFEKLKTLAQNADAVLIGCGLGLSNQLKYLVHNLIKCISSPVVLDADGINAFCGHIDLLNGNSNVILTPHIGEFKRLTKMAKSDEITKEYAQKFCEQTNCILVLKEHKTNIFSPDKKHMQNTTGNAGMAKGGSGDILSGIILSLLGQGLSPFDAACVGTWIHGRSGDICKENLGEYSMTPCDMLNSISKVFIEIVK